jgi:hypothetical protein
MKTPYEHNVYGLHQIHSWVATANVKVQRHDAWQVQLVPTCPLAHPWFRWVCKTMIIHSYIGRELNNDQKHYASWRQTPVHSIKTSLAIPQ